MNNINLYDLMAEDFTVYMRKNSKFGYDLEIENEENEMVVEEEGINPCAIDSFADFCRQFLASYDRINMSEAA